MDTPVEHSDAQHPLSKNKRYLLNYRNKQKSLGRRARLLYLTNEEYENVKDLIYEMRLEKTLFDGKERFASALINLGDE